MSNEKKPPLVVPLRDAQSSAFKEFGYDPAAQVLAIRFPNGKVTHYHDVSVDEYTALVGASSRGKFFNSHIRGDKYRPEIQPQYDEPKTDEAA